jgi:uroporphyrinogen decarboxylase
MLFEAVALDHAARLIDRRPWDISRDSNLLAEAVLEAVAVYRQESCVVGVDVYNLEAEAYGCQVQEPVGNGVPAITRPHIAGLDDIAALRMEASAGRIPMILEAATSVSSANPALDVRIPMAGPFTIGCHLLGAENMICELMLNPSEAAVALGTLTDNQITYGRMIAQRGFNVTLYESSVTPPLLSPSLFGDVIAPFIGRIVQAFREEFRTSLQVIIGGNTAPIAEHLLALAPEYVICPIETDQEAFIRRAATAPGTRVRVNMPPSAFLVSNHKDAILEADRAHAIALLHSNSTIGCLLPFDADPEIVLAVASHVLN